MANIVDTLKGLPPGVKWAGGGLVLAGSYVFYKRYKAAKGSNTSPNVLSSAPVQLPFDNSGGGSGGGFGGGSGGAPPPLVTAPVVSSNLNATPAPSPTPSLVSAPPVTNFTVNDPTINPYVSSAPPITLPVGSQLGGATGVGQRYIGPGGTEFTYG